MRSPNPTPPSDHLGLHATGTTRDQGPDVTTTHPLHANAALVLAAEADQPGVLPDTATALRAIEAAARRGRGETSHAIFGPTAAEVIDQLGELGYRVRRTSPSTIAIRWGDQTPQALPGRSGDVRFGVTTDW